MRLSMGIAETSESRPKTNAIGAIILSREMVEIRKGRNTKGNGGRVG